MGTCLTDRALIRLSGDDPRGFLQGLVTNDVTGTLPVWTALLSPQGKVLFDFLVWSDGDDLLVDCEASAAPALTRRLAMYRLRRRIALENEERVKLHWAVSPPADVAAMVDPRHPALGYRWLAPADEPAEGWLEHRLRLGVTEGQAELGDGTTLWLECNAGELNGVSYTKGCYIGQENTARMHHRSKVNRRLVVVPIAEPGERTRTVYPELGLMVEHRRVEALGDAIVPEWLAEGI